MRDKRKQKKKGNEKKLYHLHGGKRPPLACSATVFLGEQLACLVLHAAAAKTDVPLGQRSSLRSTPQPRPHSHLVPGVDWGKGSQQKAHSAWTLLYDIILKKKPD